MRKTGLVVYLGMVLACGCQHKPAGKPNVRSLAPGEKTAHQTVQMTMPHAFMDYAQLLSACDQLIHQDFDAMHENMLDLKIRKAEREACIKAMTSSQKNP